MPDCLIDKRADGVALITLNRPERRNAMSAEMSALLIEHLADCEQDPDVRCVAVTGAGDQAFCAGADIKRLHDASHGSRVEAEPSFEEKVLDLRRRQNGTVIKLHTMPKPTVAIVNGYAIGAGASYALSCDLRLLGDRARLSTGYRNLAVGGDLGGPYFLSKMVGSGIARELMFTGEMLDGRAASASGSPTTCTPTTSCSSTRSPSAPRWPRAPRERSDG